MSKDLTTIPIETIENNILLLRGEKVILDSVLAKLYGVTTSQLNQQVKRNAIRFPADFMFRLTAEEAINLRSRSQLVILKRGADIHPFALFVGFQHGTGS